MVMVDLPMKMVIHMKECLYKVSMRVSVYILIKMDLDMKVNLKMVKKVEEGNIFISMETIGKVDS